MQDKYIFSSISNGRRSGSFLAEHPTNLVLHHSHFYLLIFLPNSRVLFIPRYPFPGYPVFNTLTSIPLPGMRITRVCPLGYPYLTNTSQINTLTRTQYPGITRYSSVFSIPGIHFLICY